MFFRQKIISYFFRHPDVFIRMISEFYAFNPREIQKYFHHLDIELLSKNYYAEWDSDTIWMFKHKLNWSLFSASCRSFADLSLIEKFSSEIVWLSSDDGERTIGLAHNPKIPWTEDLLAKYEHCLDFEILSYNERINWSEALLDRFIHRWNWQGLSFQSNLPWSEQFISKYENYWDWNYILLNDNIPWTVSLVEKYFHRFDHLGSTAFASNEVFTNNIEIIEEFSEHLCWHTISRNPDLPWEEMKLLERWKDRIDWRSLSQNEYFLRKPQFFEKKLVDWMKNPKDSFQMLSQSHSLPWSITFIDRFIEFWNWKALSDNRSLPWSLHLIDHYIDQWEWGYFEPSEDDKDFNMGSNGLIGNFGIPWNIDWLIKYESFVDIDILMREWTIWDKAFKPYMEEKEIETIFKLI